MPAPSIGVSAQNAAANPGLTRVTPARTTTAGSAIIVFVAYDPTHFTSVTDSFANTYTEVPKGEVTASGLATREFRNIGGTRGAAHICTLTLDALTFGGIAMVEVLDPVSLDINDGASDATTPFVSPSATPAVAAEVIASMIWVNASGATETDTVGGSFAAGDKLTSQTDTADVTGSLAAKVINSVSAVQASWTISGPTVTDTVVWITSIQGSGNTDLAVSPGHLILGGRDVQPASPVIVVVGDYSQFPKNPIQQRARGYQ